VELLPEQIRRKKILLSPLDWGMGHTCRCVSVIHQLLAQKNELTFVGNHAQIEFIKKDFPSLTTEFINGYNIKLDSDKGTYLQMMSQAMKINGAINIEHKWLKEFVAKNEIDLIISDNRYGFYHPDIVSIIITHQLKLQIPALSGFTSDLIQKKINKFNCCWIPDDEHNLSGDLSKAKLKIHQHRIGLLNRFKKVDRDQDIEMLAIVSGPEPTRSAFEQNCLKFLESNFEKTAIVGVRSKKSDSKIELHENPSTIELENLIARSRKVISRAGYTTIMEMVSLEKTCVLIPTPGQFEQEYLATHLQHPLIEFQTESEIF